MFVVPQKVRGSKAKKSPLTILQFLMVNANLAFYPPPTLSPYAICLHGLIALRYAPCSMRASHNLR